VDVLDHVFVALSRAGSAAAIWVVLALVLAVVWRRRGMLYMIPIVYLTDLVTLGIKVATDRARPGLDPLVRVATDHSFPSGHASTSFAAATVLSAFAPRHRLLFYALATLIALSRVYVGVHYLSDVVAGAALGTAFGWAALTSLRWRGRSPRRSRRARRAG
jgi:undecaprenyl-diphosphatase